MKKVTFLLATLLIGGMMLTGCRKDPQPTPTPDPTPTPTPTTKTVVYKMDNFVLPYTEQTISPCFHYTFSYKDANGTMVEVSDATLPWSKEINVTAPFEAQLKGTVTYKENEIPSPVRFGTLGSIICGTNKTPAHGMKLFDDKEDFIEYITERPQLLEYDFTLSIK